MDSGRTIVHALIGAVVGIVLSFIPFSTIVGGAAAGFLEGPDGRDGALVGALAGLIAFVPVAAIAFVALGVFGFALGIAALPAEGFAFVALAVLAFATLVFLYTVGLSALGGYLGAFLAREYPRQHARTRRSLGTATQSRRERGTDAPANRSRETGRFDEVPDPEGVDRANRRREATDGARRSGRDRRDDETGNDRTDAPREAARWHEEAEEERDPDSDSDSDSDHPDHPDHADPESDTDRPNLESEGQRREDRES
ncbi:hypothetical protein CHINAEXTREME_04665 [Halobiforma lacisalsi AJ5]|uniref:DUF5518 domain-containing protein n=1 Tax=Natronobacterium lacisalsi AJ5 TaxID=358396 RepID=M0LMW8_NATLA|nr:DUF5518 domain-containing protein [Halobiforma lacisalsi]APW97103.1 hypothetical protein CHINAEXTREME_04665 [Halobiforma lacisalsi AJ5]EMA34438.1 hypothetical protein C445_07927 [Halobiforma lacisalsi AJ5]